MALEFLGAADGAEEYRKRVEALAKATANLQSAVDAANASPRDLIRDFGAYADEMQRVLNVQRELARLDALAALADASDTAEDSLRRVKLLVDDVLSGDRPETPRITRKLNEEFGLTVSQAGQLLAALDQIGEADGPEQIAAAIQDVRELLDPTNDKAALQAALFGSGPFSGLFGATPGVGILSGLGFSNGGYTGSGGKYEPKGIVHGGEYVFSKEATARMGVGNLETLHRQLRGYSSGGFVSGNVLNPSGFNTDLNAGRNTALQVNVTAEPKVQVVVVDDLDRIGEYMKSPQGRMIFAQLNNEQG